MSITILFPVLISVLLITLVSFEYIRIRKFMVQVALSLPVFLEGDFQDRADGPGSVGEEELVRNSLVLDGMEKEFQLARIYTLVKGEEGTFHVSSSSLGEDATRDGRVFFYSSFNDESGEFARVFRQGQRDYVFRRLGEGAVFSLILPMSSPGGRVYLSCVDLTLGRLFQMAAVNRGVDFLLILIVAAVGEGYFFILKRKNEELSLIRHEASSHRRELERVLYERTQESKVRADKYARLNMRLIAALEASNLTLVTLNMEDMTIVQETYFTYEGEEPERIEQPVSFEGFFLEYIHPNGHHVIKDALHEFINEGINEKTVELRIYHEGRWLWFRFYCRRNDADSNELVILGQMIHQEKIRHQELYEKANYDAMTHMVNRHYCYSYLEEVLEKRRPGDFPMTVAFIDADSLKQVNDILGHKVGDDYLLDIVAILDREIREEDTLGRIGGDEFLIIAPRTSREEFSPVVQRVEEEVERYNRVSDKPYQISFSLGYMEVSSHDEVSVDFILEEADSRMYENKIKKKRRGEGISVLPT